GEWHASRAQPRFRKIGITKSSKNCSPAESVVALAAPASVAQARSCFHCGSVLSVKKTPPVCTVPPPDGASGLSTIIDVSGGLPTKAWASRKLNFEASLEPSPWQVRKKSDCSPEWQVENAQLLVMNGSTFDVKSLKACVVVSTDESCAATSGRTVMKSGLHGPVPVCCAFCTTEPSSAAPLASHFCSSRKADDVTESVAPPACWISEGKNLVVPSVEPLYGIGGTIAPDALSNNSGTGNEP